MQLCYPSCNLLYQPSPQVWHCICRPSWVQAILDISSVHALKERGHAFLTTSLVSGRCAGAAPATSGLAKAAPNHVSLSQASEQPSGLRLPQAAQSQALLLCCDIATLHDASDSTSRRPCRKVRRGILRPVQQGCLGQHHADITVICVPAREHAAQPNARPRRHWRRHRIPPSVRNLDDSWTTLCDIWTTSARVHVTQLTR